MLLQQNYNEAIVTSELTIDFCYYQSVSYHHSGVLYSPVEKQTLWMLIICTALSLSVVLHMLWIYMVYALIHNLTQDLFH